jgi:hypothetical protein
LQRSPLHAINNQRKRNGVKNMKALFVQVLWSENDELHGREAEIMTVADFEPIAARVASHKTGSYDKTKINLFLPLGYARHAPVFLGLHVKAKLF